MRRNVKALSGFILAKRLQQINSLPILYSLYLVQTFFRIRQTDKHANKKAEKKTNKKIGESNEWVRKLRMELGEKTTLFYVPRPLQSASGLVI